MDIVRATKEFTFEMAHALHGYDGKCAQLHGHSYHLSVTVTGQPRSGANDPKLGMIMDFGDLKKIVNEAVISQLDHALVLNAADPFVNIAEQGGYKNIVKTPYQPTCENLLMDIVTRLRDQFKAPLRLHSVTLRETSTSYASWFAEDNV